MLAIGKALDVRAMAYVLAGSRAAPPVALPADLAPAAWVAVQEYGRRLDHALHGYEQQEEARAKQTLFNGSYGLLQYAPGWGGGVAGIAVPYLARAMGADGTWSNGARGSALGPDDAAAAAPAARAARAREVYERTVQVLGLPAPPTSPVVQWWQPLIDAATGPDLESPDDKRKASGVEKLTRLMHK
jgi:hypothetical protein